MPTDVHALFARYDFTPGWLEDGLIDPEELATFARDAAARDDPHTEHLRWRAFCSRIDRGLDDITLRRVLALVHADPDRAMAGAVLHRILEEGSLTNEQFEQVAADPWLSGSRFVARARLIRLMRSPSPTEADLWRCASEGDGRVQELLLDQDRELPPTILEFLVMNGASKRVRNRARVRMSRRQR